MWRDLFYTFGIQLSLILASIILLIKTPPMNSFYGYRTKRSSINEEYWKYANKLAPKVMIILAITSMVVGIALLILKYCFNIKIDLFWYFVVSVIVIILAPITITEARLFVKRKHENNNKKQSG